MRKHKNSAQVRLSQMSITKRQLGIKLNTLITVISICFALMGIWTNSFGVIMAMRQGGLFVGFLLFLIFLLYPLNKRAPVDRVPWYDWVFAVLGALGGLYTYFSVESFNLRALEPNVFDYVFAVITVVLVLEASRRSAGKWITILCIFFLFYALFGPLFPGIFRHRGFKIQRLLLRMYLVDEGIYGIITRVAASYIFLFILFGCFLKESGVANFFNEFALSISGGSAGGPAKVAVIASAITGTISGSGVANVTTTGSFTIPLMKKTGYAPHFAGAVEAAASSGGMFMPPIMGTAAFVMSELLGISYLKIIIAGAIPAVLYYFAVFSEVHLEALRMNLRGLNRKDLPKLKEVLLKQGHLALPLVVLVYTLFSGRSPLFAAFMALAATVVISQINKNTRMGPKKILRALDEGGRTILSVGIACVACGIIIGVISMTGVGQAFAHNIISLSRNNLILALFFTMIASLFLSMGLPGTAVYIITATVCAPALMGMGVMPIVAHFFVFYFGCLSNLTPPVALASYAAAGIAKSSPSKVAWTGLRLTFAFFIVPYIIVYSPQLLLQDFQLPQGLLILATTFLAIFSFAVAERGFLIAKQKILERLLFFISSCLLIFPERLSDIAGLILLAVLSFVHLKMNRSKVNNG